MTRTDEDEDEDGRTEWRILGSWIVQHQQQKCDFKMSPGHLSTLRELLKLPGINVNAADIDGSTPLHRAAEMGTLL